MTKRILDRSYNKETGELEQFTVLSEGGQPKLVKASAENQLLYDPEDELPFDNGLYDFLNGDHALVLSEDDPELMIAPTSNEYCYVLRVNGSTVETTPSDATSVLRGVRDAAIDQNFEPLVSRFKDIMSKQVRRDVVNELIVTFDQADRIEQTPSGWLIDSFFLVDWTASMYAATDDPDESDVRRSGSGVVETDSSYEFVQLAVRRDVEPVTVSINGESFRLTEREMLFLAKVNWLLDRREYHPDMEFWYNVDQYADVNWRTGEPTSDESEDESPDEGDVDNFNL
jgi:hypothetical protein